MYKRYYEYNGRTYSVEVVYNQYTMPTKEELRLFHVCDPELFLRRLHFETATAITNSQIHEHDRVRVVHGDFAGLVGVVKLAHERELEVFIESQDQVATLARRNVRIHFLPGDEVHISSMEYPNLNGWVTRATPISITVANIAQNLEVIINI